MKKIQRERALGKLFAQLHSRDFDKRENALFELALMLQRTQGGTARRDGPDLYSENLTRELLRIRLSHAEQRQAVSAIAYVIVTFPDSRATAIWAAGELSAEIGLPFVLATVRNNGAQLSEEAAYQACHAIRRWLSSNALARTSLEEQLDAADPLPSLRRWSTSADARLAKTAQSLIDLIAAMHG